MNADLAILNARVLTLDPRRPRAEALAAQAGQIIAVGGLAEVRELCGRDTRVLDAEGGLAIPAFHDAHCHLLSYARSLSSLDCRGLRSIADLKAALAKAAEKLPPGAWLRAVGYDEALLADGRHPDRHDLDAAVPDRAVRLQHRGLHLDILNTAALRSAGLLASAAEKIERDPASGQPTGRLYNAAELLHERLPRREEQKLRREVRLASERLLSRGITSVQDASATNGVEEWELFHRLADSGDLGVRLFMMVGSEHGRGIACDPAGARLSVRAKHSRAKAVEGADGKARMLRPYNVRLGPVKFMIDEASTGPAEVRAGVAAARAAGRAVAFHAVSEAELAIAVEALRTAGSSRSALPDRIEHGAVIPDDMLDDLREVGVTVVGQPALVYERGDVYRGEYPPDLHGWLHRAGSLLRAGIPYATGSDAPVTEPSPGLALAALRRRQTRDGAVLGSGEALDTEQALAALTLWPARAVGVDDELGLLRVGQLADVVVLDEGTLDSADDEASRQQARFTVRDGRLVWKQAQT